MHQPEISCHGCWRYHLDKVFGAHCPTTEDLCGQPQAGDIGLYCPLGRGAWMTFQPPLTAPHTHLAAASGQVGRASFLP